MAIYTHKYEKKKKDTGWDHPWNTWGDLFQRSAGQTGGAYPIGQINFVSSKSIPKEPLPRTKYRIGQRVSLPSRPHLYFAIEDIDPMSMKYKINGNWYEEWELSE